MTVTAMEILIVDGDTEPVRELAGALIQAGHSVYRVDPPHTTTALAALTPAVLVVSEAALSSPSVRTAIDLHRDTRAMAVVVVGDDARGLAGVRLVPASFSTAELVRQVLETATHDTVTDPPPPDTLCGPASRMASTPSPRGTHPLSDTPEPDESSRPTVTNMPQVVPGAVRPPVLHSLVSLSGKVFEIEADMPLSIGRAADNQLVLEHRSISRNHASIEYRSHELVLRDLGSAHGVHLNGVPVSEHVLKHGDCVQLGRFVFHLVQGGRAAALEWHKSRRVNSGPIEPPDESGVQPGAALRGELSVVELPALLQMLIAQRRSGRLVLSEAGHRFGTLHFVGGRPIHAETDAGLTGVDAFYALLPATRGHFMFQVGVEPPAETIEATATELMLEGCRRLADGRAG